MKSDDLRGLGIFVIAFCLFVEIPITIEHEQGFRSTHLAPNSTLKEIDYETDKAIKDLRTDLSRLSGEIDQELKRVSDEILAPFVKIRQAFQVTFQEDNHLVSTRMPFGIPSGVPMPAKASLIWDMEGDLIVGIKQAIVFLNNQYHGPEKRSKLNLIFHELIEVDVTRQIVDAKRPLAQSELETMGLVTELATGKREEKYWRHFGYSKEIQEYLLKAIVVVGIVGLERQEAILFFLRGTPFEEEYRKDSEILRRFSGDFRDRENLLRQLPQIARAFSERLRDMEREGQSSDVDVLDGKIKELVGRSLSVSVREQVKTILTGTESNTQKQKLLAPLMGGKNTSTIIKFYNRLREELNNKNHLATQQAL